jgi:DNA-binding LacI/PurR family transcriptional regulator
MKKNPLAQGALTANAAGIGLATRELVQARAHEIAVIAGRPSPYVTRADYLQAKRELTGESDLDLQDAILDALPESERWDPVPGSPGHQAPVSASEDEDEEGRSETEQLVDEGVVEAARDHALQAEKSATKKIS